MAKLWGWLFSMIAGISLLICIATIACWSVWLLGGRISGRYALAPYSVSVGFAANEIVIESELGERPLSIAERTQANGTTIASRSFPGLQIYTLRTRVMHQVLSSTGPKLFLLSPNGRFTRVIRISYWLIALISAIPPALWLLMKSSRRRLLRRRAANRQCLVCGYDLRGTPDRCPECGHIASHTSVTITPNAFSQSNVI